MKRIKEGIYVHRFQGNALNFCRQPYYIAGLGSMSIVASGDNYTVEGKQNAIATPLIDTGQVPTEMVQNSQFDFQGEIHWDDSRQLWRAVMRFISIGEADIISTEGTYALSNSGQEDHYWLMSTGSRILRGDFVIPVEAVSGEARLLK